MKAFVATMRVLGFVAGGAAVVWGCLIAGFANQPLPLIGAGILLILIAWVGGGWEEIAAKFGDSEVRVKRAAAKVASEGARAVREVAETAAKSENLTADERATIERVARQAKVNLWKNLANSLAIMPTVDFEDLGRMVVGEPDANGRRTVKVYGTNQSGDWTVEWRIKLEAEGETALLVVADGTYEYPEAWGLTDAPHSAKLIFGSGTIYDGEDAHFESVKQVEVLNW